MTTTATSGDRVRALLDAGGIEALRGHLDTTDGWLDAEETHALNTWQREEKQRLIDGLVADLVATDVPAEALSLAMLRVGRNDAPALLFHLDWEVELSADLTAWAVPHAWCMVEWPTRALEAEVWQDLFERAGFTIDGVVAPRPTEPLTLYRGADHDHRLGWSWTENVDRARWFADRPQHPTRGKVWTATVMPWALLAYIHESGRSESEWVVDPDGIFDVAELAAEPVELSAVAGG